MGNTYYTTVFTRLPLTYAPCLYRLFKGAAHTRLKGGSKAFQLWLIQVDNQKLYNSNLSSDILIFYFRKVAIRYRIIHKIEAECASLYISICTDICNYFNKYVAVCLRSGPGN